MKRAIPLPLDDERTVGYAILDACWPVVEAHVAGLRLKRGDWRSRNAVAARTLGRNGFAPQEVASLLTLAYEHARLASSCVGMTSLHKLIDLIPKIELLRSAPPESNIVPFGKHVGEPMAALLADRDYCAHMIAQPGFRERYGDVYNVIVNAGIAPTATPEYNRQQARFLDDAWCLRIARALGMNGTASTAGASSIAGGT